MKSLDELAADYAKEKARKDARQRTRARIQRQADTIYKSARNGKGPLRQWALWRAEWCFTLQPDTPTDTVIKLLRKLEPEAFSRVSDTTLRRWINPVRPCPGKPGRPKNT